MIYLAILLILCGLLIIITALFIETGRASIAGEKKSGGDSRSYERYPGVSELEDVDIILPGDRVIPVKEYAAGYRSNNDNVADNSTNNNEDIFISFDDEPAAYHDSDVYDSRDLNKRDKPPGAKHIVPAESENNKQSIVDEINEFDRDEFDRDEFDSEFDTIEDFDRVDSFEEIKEIKGTKDFHGNNDLKNTGKIDRINPESDENKTVSAIMFDDRSNIIDYESGVGVIDPTFSKYKSIKRIGKGKIESDYDGLSFYIDEKLYRFDFHKVYDIWSGLNYVALPLKGNSTVKLFIIENSPGFPDKVEADFKVYEKGL